MECIGVTVDDSWTVLVSVIRPAGMNTYNGIFFENTSPAKFMHYIGSDHTLSVCVVLGVELSLSLCLFLSVSLFLSLSLSLSLSISVSLSLSVPLFSLSSFSLSISRVGCADWDR